ncbi:MAG: carbohydrate kinase family protein [Candidatus Bathyarchaeota archaeon]|nr:carbohydrate kinase family protein [Candidatus Bathyarchaeota archaeon]
MLDERLEEVKGFLKELEAKREINVVVMPDFFLDRFISLSHTPDFFVKALTEVVGRKGGSIDGINQKDFRGGNAVNTASALSRLGAKVTPIVCTDRFGFHLLRVYVKSSKISLSHVKIVEKPSITTALEFQVADGKTNVMLRDVGSLADFGPQNFNDGDFEVIRKADYVCVFNWAGTRKFGTALAQTVFRHVKTKGKGKTYFDSADPTPNKEKVPDLIVKVLKANIVDVLSLNENEAVFYASHFNAEVKSLQRKLSFEELAMESAKTLAGNLNTRIDLHTTSFSATFTRKSQTIVLTFKVPVLRATGAGDAWNAGNIVGDAYGLTDDVRLTLANAIAAYYISNPKGEHPTREQLIKFCDKLKGRWKTKTDKS